MLIDTPLNVATPLEALTVVVPDRVPGPPLVGVPALMARATDAELPVIVFP